MLADPALFTRCQNILKPKYFEMDSGEGFEKVIEFILDYAEKYKGIPNHLMIKNTCNIIIPKFPEEVLPSHTEWFLDSVENFCRHKAIEYAIMDSADLLAKKDFGKMEKIIKEAIMVGLQRDLGISCFKDPRGVVEALMAENGNLSTGWKSVDNVLYQVSKGELILFAGATGGGKSVTLANIAWNIALQGQDVIYFTFELGDKLVAKRIYSMVSEIPGRDIVKNLDTMEIRVKSATKDVGNLQVKFMNSGATPADLSAYLKNYQIENNGKTPLAIVVDYIDGMNCNDRSVDSSNTFHKDRLVAEALRNLASDFGLTVYSAIQLNRDAYGDENTFNTGKIAGGISKAFTCDALIAINITDALKDRNAMQFHFMKTRNSNGVNKTVEMTYDTKTLRITDGTQVETEQEQVVNKAIKHLKQKNLENNIKTNSVKSLLEKAKGKVK